jgi:hypothetical protein
MLRLFALILGIHASLCALAIAPALHFMLGAVELEVALAMSAGSMIVWTLALMATGRSVGQASSPRCSASSCSASASPPRGPS